MRRFPTLIALVFALAGGAAVAADQQSARESVGKPVQHAQLLLKEKKFAEALASLRQADKVPDKTPYERYVIEETRAAADVESGDYPDAIKSIEAVLATGILPPAEAEKRLLSLAQLAYQTKDYAKAIQYTDEYYKRGGTDSQPRLLAAQAYYLEGDFAHAAETARLAITAIAATGGQPSEDALLMLANSAFKLKDQPAYIDALERLAARYPKPAYWTQLAAAVQRKPGFSPRLALDLDRWMIATGAMDAPGQYIEAAESALAAGLPGDAKAFLDRGYALGLLGQGNQAERQARLGQMAQRQATDDMKGLAALEAEADAAGNGTAAEKLGEAYASYGQYDKAIAAFGTALRKGGLTYPEDAKLRLGIAYLRAGQVAKAKSVLSSVAGPDGVGDLAQLWLLTAKGG